MTPEFAIEMFKQTVLHALLLVSPLLLAALVVGLAVSLFQSITSLQEQTLVFVPKLVAIALVAAAVAPWLVRSLAEFATTMIARLPDMVR